MSDTINNGGPAFPAGYSRKQRPSHDPGANWVEVDRVQPLYGGISIRDYFAAKAMPVVLQQMNREEPFIWLHEDSDSGWSHCSLAARYAYAMADAMLRARGA